MQRRSRPLNNQNGMIPPQAVEIEKALLGSCLLQPGTFQDALELLSEDCFYPEAHKKIFKAMWTLNSKSRPIDSLTVCEQLRTTGEIEDVGGVYYVTQLTNNVVNGTLNPEYCRTILGAYMNREVIRISHELIADGYSGGDAFELLEKAETSIYSIRQLVEHRTYKPVDVILVETLKHLESIRHREDHLTGITSGFLDLDKVTCGWQQTDLIILAARPSVGKTALALNLARNASRTVPVGFFSLEMSNRQLAHRALSSESGLALWYLRNGKISDEGMKDLYNNGAVPIAKDKIFIDDTPSLKIMELKAKARRMVKKDGVRIIFIDYLQLITVGQRFDRKDLEVGFISSQLKALAKELEIPIICLSQLSRDVEKRGTQGEPKLSDLRESGAIEQDADIVMFLWRPGESDIMENPDLGNYCNLKIEKHRNGTLEKFLGKFQKETQKWETVKVLDKSGMPSGNWKPFVE